MADKPKSISARAAKKLASKIQNWAKALAPNHIQSGVQVTLEKNPKGDETVKLFVDVRKFPDARAQEYGSGERKDDSRKGFRSKRQATPEGRILITPTKGKTFLAFEWQAFDTEKATWGRINQFRAAKKAIEMPGVSSRGLPSFAGIASDKNVLMNWVMHPGIYATNSGQGYLRPAVNSHKAEITKDIGEAAAEQLLDHVRTVFTRPGGKNK